MISRAPKRCGLRDHGPAPLLRATTQGTALRWSPPLRRIKTTASGDGRHSDPVAIVGTGHAGTSAALNNDDRVAVAGGGQTAIDIVRSSDDSVAIVGGGQTSCEGRPVDESQAGDRVYSSVMATHCGSEFDRVTNWRWGSDVAACEKHSTKNEQTQKWQRNTCNVELVQVSRNCGRGLQTISQCCVKRRTKIQMDSILWLSTPSDMNPLSLPNVGHSSPPEVDIELGFVLFFVFSFSFDR